MHRQFILIADPGTASLRAHLNKQSNVNQVDENITWPAWGIMSLSQSWNRTECNCACGYCFPVATRKAGSTVHEDKDPCRNRPESDTSRVYQTFLDPENQPCVFDSVTCHVAANFVNYIGRRIRNNNRMFFFSFLSLSFLLFKYLYELII